MIVDLEFNKPLNIKINGKTHTCEVIGASMDGKELTELRIKFDEPNNRVFKVISKNTDNGRQHKKWVYHSLKSFEKYGTKIIERYQRWYDVESYEFINGEWELIEKYPSKK